MNYDDLVKTLVQEGIFISLKEDNLVCQAPEGALTDELKSLIKKYKPEFIKKLQANLPSDSLPSFTVPANLIPAHCEHITPEMLPLADLDSNQIEHIAAQVQGGMVNIQDIYPLAPLQAGILFHHMMDPLNDPYVMTWLFNADTKTVVTEYINGLQGVIDRHDAFRTAIVCQDLPEPVQVVLRKATLNVTWISLDPNQDALAQMEALRVPGQQQMNLAEAPLVRLQVAPIANTGHYFVLLQVHHLISDNSAGAIIEQEMAAYRSGKLASLAAPVPYRHFVARTQYLAEHYDARAFFTEVLGDVEEPTTPFGLTDVKGDGRQIIEAHAVLSADVATQVRGLAKTMQLSPAILFHTAWAMVVAACSGRDDVVFGTVLSGRLESGSGSKNMLGVFINTLPLRVKLGGQAVADVVQQIQRDLLAILPYEQTALTLAQGCSAVPKGSPLFSAILNYRHLPEKRQDDNKAGSAFSYINTRERTNYPLSLTVDDLGVGFGIEVQVDASVAAEPVLGYMQTAMATLVNALTYTPRKLMTTLSILPPAAHQQLRAWNSTETAYPDDSCIHHLFEVRAEQQPDAVAVTFEGQQLSYLQLNERANQLAHYLIHEKNVTPDALVGICLERSLEMVVAILGVLKAGGAYVPLDPEYPQARLQYMLDDAQLTTVITQRHLLDKTPVSTAQAVCLDDDIIQAQLAQQLTQNTKHDLLTSQHLAYVIYTSGSTGNPKGVMVGHQALVNRIDWMDRQYRCSPGDRILQKTPFSFDVSVWEFLWPLSAGAGLVIAKPGGHKDPVYLSETIRTQQVTIVHFVPSMLGSMLLRGDLARCTSLRHVFCSGEALGVQHVRDFKTQSSAGLHNLYGPTEAAIDVSYWDGKNFTANLTSIPIGRPIHNIQLHVLDMHLQPVPIGVVGELHIGGVGLARGYLHRPDLTAEKFIANPFYESGHPNDPGNLARSERLYKTGDLARWLADGNVEYLGRIDHQVKIRGFRIELGEIENALSNNDWVKDAVVVAKESPTGDKRLIAYVITEQEDNPEVIENLRHHLNQTLPDYMVPTAFVLLDALPLTPNGKLDRNALPDPDLSQQHGYVAPCTDIETTLCGIWETQLGLGRVGLNDNFFHAGGDSIKALAVVYYMNQALSSNIQIRDLFQYSTIAQLLLHADLAGTNELEAQRLAGEGTIKELQAAIRADEAQARYLPTDVEDFYPLSAIQQGMVFFAQMRPNEPIYHDIFPSRLHLRHFSLPHFQQALGLLGQRHPVLRTGFDTVHFAEPMQLVYANQQALLSLVDLAHLSPEAQTESINSDNRADLTDKFGFTGSALFRCRLYRVGGDDYVLVLSFQHGILDGWSLTIIQNEWLALYKALLSGHQDVVSLLPPLGSSYRDYVAISLTRAGSDIYKDFWRNYLQGSYRNRLPFNFNSKPLQHGAKGPGIHRGYLGRESLAVLLAATQAHTCTLQELCLAAHVLLLSWLSGEQDVLTGVVTHDRPALAGAAGVAGCFLNTLPLRIQLPAGDGYSISGLLRNIRESHQQIKSHDLFLSNIASLLGENNHNGNPFFDTLLNYTDFHLNRKTEGNTQGHQPPRNREAGVELETAEMTNTLFDMEISRQGDDGLYFQVKYDKAYFAEDEIARALNYYQRILAALGEQGNRETGEGLNGSLVLSDLLGNEERQPGFNDTARDYPVSTLEALFEAQVCKTPDAVAVRQGDSSLTYEALNQQANRIAHALMARGVIAGDFVGIMVGRTTNMVAGLLGILKAGGVYVPMDPAYPLARKQHIVRAAGLKALLVDQLSEINISPSDALLDNTLLLNPQTLSACADTNPGLSRDPHALAYVIYTSGSTGEPKGVMIAHHSAVNLIHWVNTTYKIQSSDRLLLVTSMCFDLSVYDLFGILSTGASVVITQVEQIQDPQELHRLLREERITFWDSVPSTLNFLVGHLEDTGVDTPLPDLRLVFMSGDWIPVSLPGRIKRFFPHAQVQSLGGATEGTVWSNVYPVENDVSGWDSIPYGKPIANNRFYILDAQRQPVPAGVAGELYIGGEGVALGYLHDAQRTAAAFYPDPFNIDNSYPNQSSSPRMYRTGDRGRLLPDGNMEFLGRIDYQVKVRGYRVELGEIESLLDQHEGVRESVAKVFDGERGTGTQELVAYVVLRENVVREGEGEQLSPSALQEYVGLHLPIYMVPSAMVVLQALPLNSNGKVDRNALVKPDMGQYQHEYAAPHTEVEKILCGIWQEVLGVERVGLTDNFFQLGGNSLHAIRLIAKIQKANIQVVVADLINNPTIAGITSILENRSEETQYFYQYSAGDKLYSLPNKQLLFKSTFQHHWNITALINLVEVDTYLLEKALRTILKQHQGLNYQFFVENNQVLERIVEPDDEPILKIIDLSSLEDKKERSHTIETLSNQLQSTLNLSEVLYKFVLFVCGDDEPARLLWIFHHSLADRYSIEIFMEDLFMCYMSYLQQLNYSPRPATTSVAEWGNYLHQHVNSKKIKTDIDYWTSIPWHKISTLVDHPDGIEKNKSQDTSLYGGDFVIRKTLDSEYSDLLQVGRWDHTNVTTANIIFTAFTSVVSRLTKNEYVFFDILAHGRDSIISGVDLTRTIGWLAAYIPVVTKVDRSLSALEKVQSYSQQYNQIPSSGLSFNALKYLSDDPSVRSAFEAMPIAEFNINYFPAAKKEPDQNTNVHLKSLPTRSWTPSKEFPGDDHGARHSDIIWPSYINISHQDGAYIFTWIVRDNVYDKRTIEVAVEAWLNEIKLIVDSVRRKVGMGMLL